MFYECKCRNRIQEKDLRPGENCLVELSPGQLPLQLLKRKGLAYTLDYIYRENIPVLCKRCGRKMKVFLDMDDD